MAKRKKKKAASNQPLRDLYQLGRIVLHVDLSSAKLGQGVRNWGAYEQVHQKTGLSRTGMEKARLFANYYSPDELDWLCHLGSNKGKPLTKSHVMCLLNVPERRKRTSFAKRAAAQGWSVQQLGAEIRKTLPRRSRGGRQPPRPRTVDDALVAIERASKRWRRLYRVLNRSDRDNDSPGVSWEDLPRAVRTSLNKVDAELRLLERTVQRKIDTKLKK